MIEKTHKSRRGFPDHSLEELDETVAGYVDFFNGMRPHLKMGNMTPDEIEQRYYERAEESDHIGKLD